jgi:hypothetical protein
MESYWRKNLRWIWSIVPALDGLRKATIPPQRRVLLENLILPQLVKKFLSFCRTRKFILAFKIYRHLSLSWARSIHSRTPSTFLKINFNTPVHSTPKFQVVSYHQISPPKSCMKLFFPPYMLHAPRPPQSFWYDQSKNIWWGEEFLKLHMIYIPLTKYC